MNKKKKFFSKCLTLLLLIFLLFFGIRFLIKSGLKEDTAKNIATKDKITIKKKYSNKVEKPKKLIYSEIVNQEIQQNKLQGHLEIPLYLQTDKKWKQLSYGTNNGQKDNTIEFNGCALTSLAMITSFLDKKLVTPADILQWAGNNYFVDGQGTSWNIFSDYAQFKGYTFENLGVNIAEVKEHLNVKHPIIVSVKPGTFTRTGHIMVISGTSEDQFWINDPNDSEQKRHSIQKYTSEELLENAVNFWAIYTS